MYFLHAINSDRQTRLLNVLGQIAMILGDKKKEFFLGVKSDRCVTLTTLPPSWAIVTKSGNLNSLERSGHLGPVMGLILLTLTKLIEVLQVTSS